MCCNTKVTLGHTVCMWNDYKYSLLAVRQSESTPMDSGCDLSDEELPMGAADSSDDEVPAKCAADSSDLEEGD